MTEHQPGTREWAEAEARKGAKVRHEAWGPTGWLTYRGDTLFHDDGKAAAQSLSAYGDRDGWSLYEPAPAQAPDLAARVAELEADMSLVRQILHIPNAETKAALAEAEAMQSTPTFTTSRKPADPVPKVMTDDEIQLAAKRVFEENEYGAARRMAVAEAIRLTRASIRTQLAANEAGARAAAYTIWNAENSEHDSVKFPKAINAALKAHKEGV